ncbi:glucose 1-dehydrogenase [Streptomyces sp. BE20]|uniref:SDR family NAD(P)-dependent oxidoreductase n=1 Tax=Streptomyces sp. BE20 TaxID=3002525 RepID=UPI002E777714|nr:glucose 1-dehydrogenase [Streptomyces sp. BE20]MEE1821977.1 glucose 1-dehydrogenase [Streptomyces sp. BE20]
MTENDGTRTDRNDHRTPGSAGEFDGRTVLITGGTSGMGLATARHLLASGAEVVITGRDEARLRRAEAELASGDRVFAVRADSAKPADLARLADLVGERHGRLDGVFANAGVGIFELPTDVTEKSFDHTVDVNFKGVFFTVQHALPLLEAAGGGSVVLNASWTLHRGLPNAPVYAATKAAVHNLARTLGSEFAGRGIRVNSVSPGYIVTEMFDAVITEQSAKDAVLAQVPLGRLGEAEDIAETVAFLLSSRSSYITGQDFVVDGGVVAVAGSW